jgi:periplasmic protein TonB
MILRCLLFCSDEGTAAPILQALTDLGVEGELCPEAVTAVEKVTQQSFQIVIIDWEKQPEAALLLTTARERKAATRPLTLAIVSDDASIPQALQAGANSILRKPLQLNQITDTLKTACDLLRSKLESAANVAQAAAAGVSGTGAASVGGLAGSVSTIPASVERGQETNLRAGEFLQSASSAPGGQFETEADAHESQEHSSVEPVDSLKDLEPMAASVAKEKPASDRAPDRPSDRPSQPSEPRGLEWYLKTRAASLPPVPVQSSAPAASAKPELLGFDQASSYSPPPETSSDDVPPEPAPKVKSIQLGIQKAEDEPKPETRREQKPERKPERKRDPELLAGDGAESEDAPRPRSRFRGPLAGALLLAGCAILAAPQAPWHPKMRVLWSQGQQALHGWLNPQPATVVQAPVAHEDFGRAGDEYKLPATENIPDATTDPSQIQVVPVIDPTAKKTTPDAANSDQPPTQGDPAATTPNGPTQPTGTQAPETQTPQPAPPTTTPAAGPVGSTISTPPATIVAVAAPPHSDPPPVSSLPAASVAPRPAPPKAQEPHYATPPGNVPSSLKSQMASMTPDASGNKAAESAMQSIEPVAVPELTERALLTDQPALDYPAAARGQQGTVVLQVLIGRDGSVQDAKFLQGSLVFAKVAIDGVKSWKFKPYSMNGRPVSVQTSLTITFRPGPPN